MTTTPKNRRPLFPSGRVLIAPRAAAVLPSETVAEGLSRHLSGDWGEVCDEDRKENEFSLKGGFRILSSYTAKDGTKFWIITEADRSATTILLPEEY